MIFFYQLKDEKRNYVIFHVDDGIITSNDKQALDDIVNKLKEKFELKVNTSPDKYLGIQIKRDIQQGKIGLNQEEYIVQCAEKFKVTGMRPFSTPLEAGFVDTLDENDKPVPSNVPYRSIIGALLYVARMTRLDTLYAVSVLSKHLAHPQQ